MWGDYKGQIPLSWPKSQKGGLLWIYLANALGNMGPIHQFILEFGDKVPNLAILFNIRNRE